ncbi:hypothetical protein GOODEAATRI_025236 [Goodea atripinnis]|uniref:Uncharacterized protein n=1 Tax=Goodea atripinnis TaxID=208336 RepID=A0ABV0MKL8_9TELE
MRRIRANAIAILTVAWILGTFYYLWQDNKPASTPSSSASQTRGRGHGQKLVPGRLEIHRDDRTIPLILGVSPGIGSADVYVAQEHRPPPVQACLYSTGCSAQSAAFSARFLHVNPHPGAYKGTSWTVSPEKLSLKSCASCAND